MALGLLVLALAAASSLFLALLLRLGSLVSTLLVAYVIYVGNLALVGLLLSPTRDVTPHGLALAEIVILTAALGTWRAMGRPGLATFSARAALREVVSDPVTLLYLVLVLALLAYEGLLASSPPNNMDSLTYHLAKAAAWKEHGGYYWIPNAPEVEINEYQPLAEQQVMFVFAATGSGALYALPQFLAELAVLAAVFGSTRRLGFGVRSGTRAACLTATFSFVALEAVTGQVDLVAASFPVVAVSLLLNGGPLEAAFAGTSVAFGLGTKLTTALVLPIVIAIALIQSRRVVTWALAGGVAGFVTVGMWGYVENALHTGHVLGLGTGPVQFRGSPAYPGSVANAFYLMYGLMDLSVLSNRTITVLAVGGGVGAAAAAGLGWRRRGAGGAAADAAGVAVPFFAPYLVIGGAALVAFTAARWGFPIRGPNGVLAPLEADLNMTYTRISNEDYSALGPVGIVALLVAAVLAVVGYIRRRASVSELVLASTIPVFLILISLESRWHVFLIRFFLLPAVLTAPLLARLLRNRAVAVAYLAVGALSIGLTITRDQPKPLDNPYGHGRPWTLTQVTALDTNSDSIVARALADYQLAVPPHACIGALLGESEPSYLLYGPHFEHHVFYLPPGDPLTTAYRYGVDYVVISGGTYAGSAGVFETAGWRTQGLGSSDNPYWLLAIAPNAAAGRCMT
jgi:hypothetical protein